MSLYILYYFIKMNSIWSSKSHNDFLHDVRDTLVVRYQYLLNHYNALIFNWFATPDSFYVLYAEIMQIYGQINECNNRLMKYQHI